VHRFRAERSRHTPEQRRTASAALRASRLAAGTGGGSVLWQQSVVSLARGLVALVTWGLPRWSCS
jgi:hypothetical protein